MVASQNIIGKNVRVSLPGHFTNGLKGKIITIARSGLVGVDFEPYNNKEDLLLIDTEGKLHDLGTIIGTKTGYYLRPDNLRLLKVNNLSADDINIISI